MIGCWESIIYHFTWFYSLALYDMLIDSYEHNSIPDFSKSVIKHRKLRNDSIGWRFATTQISQISYCRQIVFDKPILLFMVGVFDSTFIVAGYSLIILV